MNKLIQCQTQEERILDISKRSGYSVDIVKKILDSEAENTLNELKQGKRVVLSGLCSMTPTFKKKLGLLGMTEKEVMVDCVISPLIIDMLNALEKYDIQTETIPSEYVKSMSHYF